MAAKPHTVLVVDDNSDLRDLAAVNLNNAGFLVNAVANGLEAVRYLEDHEAPSLILLDIEMPVMTGIEFVAVVTSCDQWRSIPIVLWSGKPDIEQVARRLSVGGSLRKPGSREQLISVIEDLTKRRVQASGL